MAIRRPLLRDRSPSHIFLEKAFIMALLYLSHEMEVAHTDDGISVKLPQRELDSKAIWILVDELVELARESGRTNLFVDFANVRRAASIVFGKLITLDKKLREINCRLSLCNVDGPLYQSFRAARLTENLNIRASAAGVLQAR